MKESVLPKSIVPNIHNYEFQLLYKWPSRISSLKVIWPKVADEIVHSIWEFTRRVLKCAFVIYSRRFIAVVLLSSVLFITFTFQGFVFEVPGDSDSRSTLETTILNSTKVLQEQNSGQYSTDLKIHAGHPEIDVFSSDIWPAFQKLKPLGKDHFNRSVLPPLAETYRQVIFISQNEELVYINKLPNGQEEVKTIPIHTPGKGVSNIATFSFFDHKNIGD